MKLSYESPSQCVAVGWPWHGPIKLAAGEYKVALPTGRQVAVAEFGGIDTLLWDIGRPDIASEAIAAEGGAWWGKAILRYASAVYEDRADYQVAAYGADRLKHSGVPLYRPPVADQPGRVFMCSMLIKFGMLQITAKYQGRTIVATRAVTPDQLGQGEGQPAFAAHDGSFASDAATRLMITDAEPGRYFSSILDVKDCKVLLGITGYTSANNTVAASPPPATAKHGPRTYCALVEVELTADFFDSDGASGIAIRLIEDRRSALGDPSFSESDETANGVRTRLQTWVQTRYLVTAWYAPGGGIVSVRCSRTQESKHTREIRTDGGTQVDECNAQRTTALKMYRAGIQFDEVELLERLQVVQRGGTSLRVIRTIQLTDDDDDVADSGDLPTTNVSWPEPLAVYGPGLHGVATSVAYIYTLDGAGQQNLLREQDLRAVWVCALSNKLGGVITAVEPYDYEPGAASYITRCHYRPAAHPHGVDVRSLRTQEPHSGDGATRFTRSFFYFNAGATGSYNPVTGEVLRGSANRRESWV